MKSNFSHFFTSFAIFCYRIPWTSSSRHADDTRYAAYDVSGCRTNVPHDAAALPVISYASTNDWTSGAFEFSTSEDHLPVITLQFSLKFIYIFFLVNRLKTNKKKKKTGKTNKTILLWVVDGTLFVRGWR